MKAFIIGNVTIDETIAVSEIPAPGLSLHGETMSREIGGKGANQAIVMARCGVETRLIAGLGEGFRGQEIRTALAREKLDARLVDLAGCDVDMSIVLRLPDGDNINITTRQSADALRLEQVLAEMADAKAGDLIILQGNLSDELTLGLLHHARQAGLISAFNPSPCRASFAPMLELAHCVFINVSEAIALTGYGDAQAIRLLRQKGVAQIVLTLGEEGALLGQGDEIIAVPSVKPEHIADTTGAGDTFMAASLASASLRGRELDVLALAHAARASAITISRIGTQSAFPDEAQLAAILATR